jgi:hypothetical protein
MNARPIALAFLLVACQRHEEAVSFPVSPPANAHRSNLDTIPLSELHAVAGIDARDCGIARGPDTSSRVVQCATEALHMRRPFVCRFAAPILSRGEPLPAGAIGAWNSDTAYAGNSGGEVYAFLRQPPTLTEFVPVRLFRSGETLTRPLRITTGMTKPSPRTVPPAVETPFKDIGGMILIETVIDTKGVPTAVRTVKSLPNDLDLIARKMVLASRFEPGRLFGVPLPLYWNVVVRVEDGVLWMETADAAP